MGKRSDLGSSRSTKSKIPPQLLRGIFTILLSVPLRIHPKKALPILDNLFRYLLVALELRREDYAEEGEMEKISSLEMLCLNP